MLESNLSGIFWFNCTMRYFFLLLLLVSTFGFSQLMIEHSTEINQEKLNQLILEDLNIIRKKEKVAPLKVDAQLKNAALDHSNYLLRKRKLTHKQHFTSKKKTPKNRVDFYGGGYEFVGENIQFFDMKTPVKLQGDKEALPMGTYERIAKQLVENWKNSKAHYKNIIHPYYTNTYTTISVDKNRNLYACQLFGDKPFELPTKVLEARENIYKPERSWRCWRSAFFMPKGRIEVNDNNEIYFILPRHEKLFKSWFSSLRLANPRFNADGIVADVLVKSQYTCGETNNFNGNMGAKGVTLKPVYRKDYTKFLFIKSKIYLGKVPNWVDEEYEINLSLINNKRTCASIQYDFIPSELDLDLDLSFDIEIAPKIINTVKRDTLSYRINYSKSDFSVSDTNLLQIRALLNRNNQKIEKAKVTAYASIEGSTETNLKLQQERANNIVEQLIEFNLDSSDIDVLTQENFKAFRNYLKSENKVELINKSNEELKVYANENSNSLEAILQKHRYAKLVLFTKTIDTLAVSATLAAKKINNYNFKGDEEELFSMQAALFNAIVNKDTSINVIDNLDVKRTKRTLQYHLNNATFSFFSDTSSNFKQSAKTLREEINRLQKIDEKNENIANTSLKLEYLEILNGFKKLKLHKFVKDSLPRRKIADKKLVAKIALLIARDNDIALFYGGKMLGNRKYLFNYVKRYVKKADLTADEFLEVASYYSFLQENKYAYKIAKREISRVTKSQNLIFFLKLIQLTDAKPSRSQYLAIFKKVSKTDPDNFCTYFNNPALNFQILDDPEIKEIFCKECKE